MAKWYIHVNRGTIDHNRKYGTDDHPIAIKKGLWGKGVYCSDVLCNGPVRVRYDAGGILKCGAKVVIETDVEPEVLA